MNSPLASRRDLLFLCIAFFITATPAYSQQTRGFQKVEPSMYSKQYALVIGINDYSDQSIRDLKFAVNDASSIQQTLIDVLGFDEENINVLSDRNATKDNILRALGRYIEEDIEENSQLLVYFAGHGETIGSEAAGQQGYLLPHDAQIGTVSSLYSTGIAMNDLQNLARTIRPKHVLFLMDACYGGLANTRSAGTSIFVRNAMERNARQLITAGSASEQVIESSEWQHSAFTKVFLDAVREQHADSNSDGIISTMELFSYIENRVPYYAASLGGQQTPQYTKLTPDDGTFLFVLDEEALQDLQQDEDAIFDLNAEALAKQFTTPVKIKANVDNARVYVDGNEVGYLSNGTFDHRMKPGFYKIELKRDRYAPGLREIEVMPDTSLAVNFDMPYLYSKVHFNVTPADAAIYVDGELVGSGGSFEEEISKGKHTLTINKKGYKPYTEDLNFAQNEIRIDRELEFIQARLELYSIPTSATVVVNGETFGVTPANIPLGYGEHTVLVRKAGFRDDWISVEITESGLQRQMIKLRETPEVIARRVYRQRQASHITNLLITGLLGTGTYIGHTQLRGLADDAAKDDEYRDVYYYSSWGALGLTGIMAISTITRTLSLFNTRYQKILEEELEKEFKNGNSVKVGAVLTPDGQAGLHLRYTF